MNQPIDPAFIARITEAQFSTTQRFSVRSPVDSTVVAEVADCQAVDASRAADVAVIAFAQWKQTTAYERAAVLRRWHTLIAQHEDLLAVLMSVEMGKPITESIGEVRYANSMIEWFAEDAKRVYGESIPSQLSHKRLHTIKQPCGVVYAITPWNFPAATVTRKVAPALAAGCAVIHKPAEQSPLSALALATLWREAGGAADLFQVLTACDPKPVSDVLLADMRVRVLTFTGSTEVGMHLYERSARTMKRLALELGGHAPFLVFDDADIPRAVREVMACKFRNGGQTCVCTNRIYVQEQCAAQFTEQLVNAVGALLVGDPLDTTTQIGPLVNAQGYAKVQSHVDDAVQHGARVLTGGRALGGLFFQPTVLADVTMDMKVLQEETFGPVAPVLTFRDEAEAIALANESPYGLAAYLWTDSLQRAYRVSEALEFGIVGINDGVPSTAQAPFGGVKMSGIGRECGHWGIEEFLDVKYVSVGLH